MVLTVQRTDGLLVTDRETLVTKVLSMRSSDQIQTIYDVPCCIAYVICRFDLNHLQI